MKPIIFCFTLLFIVGISPTINTYASTVDSFKIKSIALQDSVLELNSERHVSVYLPSDYQSSKNRYPVIYYFHGFFWSDRQMFADGVVKALFDKAINNHTIRPFILVAADFSNQRIGSFYENSPVSGMWLDFITNELVPEIDARYRTLANSQSRATAGEMIGGYAALKLVMLYPDLFKHAYALHPVGTGTGYTPMSMRPDWDIIHKAKSFSEIQAAGNIFSTVFTAMAQAYSPNTQRPPLFADYIMENENGVLSFNLDHSLTLRSNFLLDELLQKHYPNMLKLGGVMFDWGRYDSNQDHVLANQNFTRLLDFYGIKHEAEEYRGGPFDKNWIEDGRVEANMLPFLNQHLDFAKPAN